MTAGHFAGHFLAGDQRRIAFADTGGDGPAVLCLNGLTRTMLDYADLAAHLAPEYRVILTDYRGRGDSDWAEDAVAEYTPIVEGQDAAALLAHLGVERAAIIGTSRGGIIGMLLAAGQPDLVTAVVLNDIGPVVERAGLDFIMTYLGKPPGLPDYDAAVVQLKSAYGAAFPDLTEAAWRAYAKRSFAEGPDGLALRYDPKLRDATEAALETAPSDLWAVFDAIRAPVLAIRGANSELMTAATLQEMAARRPGLDHVTIANRGHVPFLDEPEALAAIDEFLQEHAR